jgi:hypothetical protein
VRSDWNVNDPSSEAYILNKPEIPDISGLATTSYVVSEDNIHEEEIMSYTTTELDKNVDKVDGKGLSTNDYTTDEKNKLAGIASGAEVNVQSDWNATSGDAFIKNKPDLSVFATISYVVSEDDRHEEEIMSYTTTELDKKVENGDIGLNTLFEFKEDESSREDKVIGRLEGSPTRLKNRQKLQHAGINID